MQRLLLPTERGGYSTQATTPVQGAATVMSVDSGMGVNKCFNTNCDFFPVQYKVWGKSQFVLNTITICIEHREKLQFVLKTIVGHMTIHMTIHRETCVRACYQQQVYSHIPDEHAASHMHVL